LSETSKESEKYLKIERRGALLLYTVKFYELSFIFLLKGRFFVEHRHVSANLGVCKAGIKRECIGHVSCSVAQNGAATLAVLGSF
jgi:hypothetical protein